ncbi:MAG: corrinoid protein [Acidobacteriota bacterium]
MPEETALYRAILEGDAKGSKAAAEEELNRGMDPQSIVNEQMIAAMDEVGRRFECHEYFVPEMLISARAMKSALEVLRPHLGKGGVSGKGKVLIGTVKGDLHDIGKNLVGAMLEGAGFEVVDLGTDVSAERFVQTAKDENAHVVALSALLTTTMPSMKGVIEALASAGLRSSVKVMVGGAPLTPEFAKQIGADGYAATAGAAAHLARELVS